MFYKCVHYSWISARGLESIIRIPGDNGGVYYGPGRKTVPLPGYGPLTAFKTAAAAQSFLEDGSNFGEIWRCEGEISKREIVNDDPTVHSWPRGTIFMESITLVSPFIAQA
jgi:hypothetical protein